MMKTPTFQSSIPPIQKGSEGDDLVAAANDRFRRIEMLLGATTKTTTVTPAAGATAGTWKFEVPTGTLGGTSFTLSQAPNPPSSLELELNGVVQLIGVDITLAGNAVTYLFATDPNDWHFARYET